jgi:hypothetical protein
VHVEPDLLGVHHQHGLAVQLEEIVGAFAVAVGALHHEFIVGDRQAGVAGVPVEVGKERADKVVLDLGLGLRFQPGLVGLEAGDQFGDFGAGLLFRVRHPNFLEVWPIPADC